MALTHPARTWLAGLVQSRLKPLKTSQTPFEGSRQSLADPGPCRWPEWFRTLITTSVLGLICLFHALVGYGASALIGEGLHLYHLPLGPEAQTPTAQQRALMALTRSRMK